MYFQEEMKKYKDKKVKLFIDMDGVIVDYVVGNTIRYDLHRPLINPINKIKELSKQENFDIYILSVTKYSVGINEKLAWLDKYLPEIKKENRIILCREANNMDKSPTLKSNYLKQYKDSKDTLILIDDDPRILEAVRDIVPNVILYKDTVLED